MLRQRLFFRQRNTLKKQLEFVSELVKSKKLSNLGFIFNDVKRGGKVGYYGYGNTYGKNYGRVKTKKIKKFKVVPA